MLNFLALLFKIVYKFIRQFLLFFVNFSFEKRYYFNLYWFFSISPISFDEKSYIVINYNSTLDLNNFSEPVQILLSKQPQFLWTVEDFLLVTVECLDKGLVISDVIDLNKVSNEVLFESFFEFYKFSDFFKAVDLENLNVNILSNSNMDISLFSSYTQDLLCNKPQQLWTLQDFLIIYNECIFNELNITNFVNIWMFSEELFPFVMFILF